MGYSLHICYTTPNVYCSLMCATHMFYSFYYYVNGTPLLILCWVLRCTRFIVFDVWVTALPFKLPPFRALAAARLAPRVPHLSTRATIATCLPHCYYSDANWTLIAYPTVTTLMVVIVHPSSWGLLATCYTTPNVYCFLKCATLMFYSLFSRGVCSLLICYINRKL